MARYPTPFALFPFNLLPHDLRSCLAPLIDPLMHVAVPKEVSPSTLVERVYGDSSAGITSAMATTLCDIEQV